MKNLRQRMQEQGRIGYDIDLEIPERTVPMVEMNRLTCSLGENEDIKYAHETSEINQCELTR